MSHGGSVLFFQVNQTQFFALKFDSHADLIMGHHLWGIVSHFSVIGHKNHDFHLKICISSDFSHLGIFLNLFLNSKLVF